MKKIISTALFSALLVGCHTNEANPPLPTTAPLNNTAHDTNATKNEHTYQNPKHISAWSLRGAMAARHAKKATSAMINWEQNGLNHYKIRLFGPLGSGTVMIEKQNGHIQFQDGKKIIHSNNDNDLLFKQTGVHLPVNYLYYWVRGITAPGKASGIEKNASGQITQFAQNGYVVQFDKYTAINHTILPGFIRLYGKNVTIKLAIKQWHI